MIELFKAYESPIVQSLVLSVFIISLAQSPIRRTPALLFAVCHLAFNIFLSDIYGYYYFIFGAYWDAVIIMSLSNIKIVPRLARDLQTISFLSIMLNAFGWTLWMKRIDLTPYVMGYAFLYIMTLHYLIKYEGSIYGNFKMGGWRDCFRVFDFSRIHEFNKAVR